MPVTGQDGTSVNSGYIMAMNWELNIFSQAKIKEHVLAHQSIERSEGEDSHQEDEGTNLVLQY